ncbi:hypothetical protein CI109_100494 [Kwoniella shandongensis]|uniref:Uncharacterized protein n=1 Tax=Kwoniella shandongensis TaxID=1734106 RepID=A0A5M6C3S3_9TREE|nr:uncharacterized protein CI109_001663 [Kwoniella shandongensis]KAA5529724.1 hypothetical protein CI109_001663 [Kwoniella shandongensis]
MKSLFRPFPVPLTGRQWFYIIFTQGFVAGLIDGGANFGIAYAMYHNAQYVTIWVLAKNTIAGALGVTALIQCAISMLITSSLVHTDIHHKVIPPLPYVWPHVEHLPDPATSKLFAILGVKPNNYYGQAQATNEKIDSERSSSNPSPSPSSSAKDSPPSTSSAQQPNSASGWLIRYIRLLLRFTFEGTESNIFLHHPFSLKTLLHRMFLTALQGLLIGFVFGLPLFLVFIVVIAPIYRHDNLAEKHWKWAPMVINGAYGMVLGWMTNPVMAALAMGSQAEHCLVVIPGEGDEESGSTTTNVEDNSGVGVHTIVEEQEEDENGEGFLSPPLPHQSPSTSLRSSRLPPPSSPKQTPSRPRARSRAASNLSNRSKPPLTANYSDLPIAPPSSPAYFGATGLSTPRSAPLSNAQRQGHLVVPTLGVQTGRERAVSVSTPPHTAPISTSTANFNSLPRTRNRGMTISTITSTTYAGDLGGSWSYALGGTGGRAQRRPRAASTLSGSARAAAAAQETNSYAEGKTIFKNGAERKEEVLLNEPPASGSMTRPTPPASWDVFGRVEGAKSPTKDTTITKEI